MITSQALQPGRLVDRVHGLLKTKTVRNGAMPAWIERRSRPRSRAETYRKVMPPFPSGKDGDSLPRCLVDVQQHSPTLLDSGNNAQVKVGIRRGATWLCISRNDFATTERSEMNPDRWK
jgi:hypothetical protein